MRFFLLQAVVVVPAVLSLLPVAFAAQGITLAGTVFRAIQPHAPAKQSTSSSTIKGLLPIRQIIEGCDPGFHACDAISCCRNDQNCVPGGCCPKGEVCSGGSSGQCTDPSLDLCPDGSGCCRPDETCIRDNGVPLCQEGGGGGGGGGGGEGGGGDVTTTKKTTSHKTSTSRTTSTTVRESTTTFSDSETTSFTLPSITPIVSQTTVFGDTAPVTSGVSTAVGPAPSAGGSSNGGGSASNTSGAQRLGTSWFGLSVLLSAGFGLIFW